MRDNSKSIFIKCNCGCGVLELEVDDFEDPVIQFNISLWTQNINKLPMSKKERIQWCDHIMKTGNPWADHTIISVKDAKRIIDFLTRQLVKYGKKKQN